MKGRGVPVAIASLVLAASVAVPALSVAQEPAAPGDPAASDQAPTLPTPPEPPSPPAQAGGSGSGGDGNPPPQSSGSGEPASTPPAGAPELVGTQKRENKAAAGKASSVTVSIKDFFFSPESVTVAVGDSVTWVNNGAEPHSATANDGSFDTGVFNGGGSRSVTFSNAGSFAYICSVHPNMTGTVRVSSSGGGGGGSEAAAVGSSGAAASGSRLASTGSDLPAVFAIGLMLLLCGAVLRRHTPSA